MPEIKPVTKDQLFEKKIAENTGSDYNVGDISDVVPVTKDQALLKEIALNSAGQSGDIEQLEEQVTTNTSAIGELTERFKVLTIPISSVTIAANDINLLHNNPCPTGYIPISAMFDRGVISNDSVLLSVYLDSGTDVRVIMYNCSNASIELNGSVTVLCIKS